MYTQRLIERLLAGDDGNTYVVIRSASAGARLYASWNYLRRPRIREQLDVVHATGLAIPPVRGAALVATIHDLAIEEMPEVVPRIWRQIYRKGLRTAIARAEVICAVSAATRQSLIDTYGVAADRIVLTPNAPNVGPGTQRDDTVFARLGITTPFVLNVGTLEPRKNQPRLVQAFAAAGAPLNGHALVIAGVPGWGAGAVQQQVEASGVGDRVVLTGGVTDAEMAALYARAQVFALPSLHEGFGVPLAEALGFGIPAVAGITPALNEVGGGRGVVRRAGRHERALAAALVRLATDDALRTSLTSAAVSQAAQYTWEATAAATRDAYAKARRS